MPLFPQTSTADYKGITIRIYYLLVAIVLFVSMYKDTTNYTPMPPDVRNRVVGARMMKDGLSPYFYVWKDGDPVRYYDIVDANAKVSNASASPFFHIIIAPLADLPELQINILLLLMQYLALAGTCLFAVLCVPKHNRRSILPIIMGLAVVFTYTTGWRANIANGQNYMLIPLLLMGCLCLIQRQFNFMNGALFAVIAGSLILIRPVAGLFFLPLVFYPSLYLKWGISVISAMLIYVVLAFYSPLQRLNWSEYFKSIPVQAQNWQNPPNRISPLKYPKQKGLAYFEGVHMDSAITKPIEARFFAWGMEYSNLYILYNKITGKQISINHMMIIGTIGSIIILLPLFLAIVKRIKIPKEGLLAIGFSMYVFFTFCLPIPRLPYYVVEFLFPFVLITIWCRQVHILPFFLLALGLYFIIATLPHIPMRRNFGQLFILMAILLLAYRPLFVSSYKAKKLKVKDMVYWL